MVRTGPRNVTSEICVENYKPNALRPQDAAGSTEGRGCDPQEGGGSLQLCTGPPASTPDRAGEVNEIQRLKSPLSS